LSNLSARLRRITAVTMKIKIPSPTSPTTLNVPATAAVLSKKPLLVVLEFETAVDVGVDRITVVTTMVLPLETERNVDGELEGVKVGLGAGVEVEVVEGVGGGGGAVVDDEVEGNSEVDGGRDVELLPRVSDGGGGVVGGVSLRVNTELGLL